MLMLQLKFLNLALEHLFFKQEIDLFATNINTQFGKYAAFRPDPGAMSVYAFSIDWSDLKFYVFPPISVIPRVLSKVRQDSAEAIIAHFNQLIFGTQPCLKRWYRLQVC